MTSEDISICSLLIHLSLPATIQPFNAQRMDLPGASPLPTVLYCAAFPRALHAQADEYLHLAAINRIAHVHTTFHALSAPRLPEGWPEHCQHLRQQLQYHACIGHAFCKNSNGL